MKDVRSKLVVLFFCYILYVRSFHRRVVLINLYRRTCWAHMVGFPIPTEFFCIRKR